MADFTLSRLVGTMTEVLNGIRSWHVFTVGAIFLVSEIIRRVVIYPRFFSPLRHAPGPPRGNWLWGQTVALLAKEPGNLQRDWQNQYGDRSGVMRLIIFLGIERVIFLGPQALQKILVSDWMEYPRPQYMRNILGLTTGFGLLTVTGNRHKQMKKFMNPAFSIQNLTAQTDMYYGPIYKLVDILSKSLSSQRNPAEGKEILVYEWMSKVTLDIICLTAFGYDSNSLENPNNELASAYHDLLELQSGANLAVFIIILALPGGLKMVQSNWFFKHRWLWRKLGPLGRLATLLESMERIKAVSSEMLALKLSEAAIISPSDSTTKKDIMSLLVQARYNEEMSKLTYQGGIDPTASNYRMSNKEMLDQVLTFLGAGHETTASGMSWTLWLLAKHPQIQDRLRREVADLLRKNPTPDYRTLKDCQLLDCVIMESLRLFPPVPVTTRHAVKGDWIDGIFVPKGTLIHVPIRAINQWKETWGPDAEEFRPERWLNLPATYNSSHSFQTFIVGPHACIGRTMAIVEMKAILSVLICNFSFEPISASQVPNPTAAVTMKPEDSLPLRIRPVSLKSASAGLAV